MKAAVFQRTGGPEVLEIAEIDRPDPGPGEALVRVTSAGLNRADALFRQGRYLKRPRTPSRSGFEAAGIVEAVGEGCRFKPGDRVASLPGMLEASINGGAAEFVVAKEEILIPSPPTVDDRDAGGVWMQYLTAWGALNHAVRLREGQFVVVTAASSSDGLAAVQLARRLGATPIATTTSGAKIEKLRDNGAEHVIDVKREDYARRIKQIAGGRGVDVVFDAVAGAALGDHFRACRPEGIVLIYGALAGATPEINPGQMIGKNLTLRGYTLFPLLNDKPALAEAVSEIAKGLADGRFTLRIDRRFALSEIAEAHRYLESNAQVGKIVICPGA